MTEEGESDDPIAIPVPTRDGPVLFAPDTRCDACGDRMDGVLIPDADDAFGMSDRGVPLCQRHYEDGDHYDTDESWTWCPIEG